MLVGLADSLTMISFAMPYYNITTSLVGRTAICSKKLFRHLVQDILPAYHAPFILPVWQFPIAEAEQQLHDSQQSSAAFYNTHAHTLSEINIGSHDMIQSSQTKA